MSEAFKEKPIQRTLNSLEWLRQLARDEDMEEPEDEQWLFDLLNQAYTRGSADGRRAAVFDMHAYACAAERVRADAAKHQTHSQEEWSKLPPEEQERLRLERRAWRKANLERRELAMQVSTGKMLLKKEKESGT